MKITHQLIEKKFKALSNEKINIKHFPPTHRYLAEAKVAILEFKTEIKVLAWRQIEAILEFSIEAVAFISPPEKLECGLYFVFRMHFGKIEIESLSVFCFYDGNWKSPCFKNEVQALDWIKKIEKKYDFEYNLRKS